ncbi:hypothetical protein LTR66_009042 [Elasticomyces elasticus]|nr:hypothetical protein LTR66_009042 [Elasticomyces elasticus]
MPRIMAPPPSGEFEVRLIKPFSGPASHTVEVIGEPNRSATVHVSDHSDGSEKKKTGTMPKDDVNELMNLINQLRGFPSHPSDDIYGLDARVELNTMEIQWTNESDDSVQSEVTAETKETFKEIVDSLMALGRQFAKKDAAI